MPQMVRQNRRKGGKDETALLAKLEEALGLQDGAGRRESAQSRRCLKGAGPTNNVSLRGGGKQEAS